MVFTTQVPLFKAEMSLIALQFLEVIFYKKRTSAVVGKAAPLDAGGRAAL
jgi:hypothetical protein